MEFMQIPIEISSTNKLYKKNRCHNFVNKMFFKHVVYLKLKFYQALSILLEIILLNTILLVIHKHILINNYFQHVFMGQSNLIVLWSFRFNIFYSN